MKLFVVTQQLLSPLLDESFVRNLFSFQMHKAHMLESFSIISPPNPHRILSSHAPRIFPGKFYAFSRENHHLLIRFPDTASSCSRGEPKLRVSLILFHYPLRISIPREAFQHLYRFSGANCSIARFLELISMGKNTLQNAGKSEDGGTKTNQVADYGGDRDNNNLEKTVDCVIRGQGLKEEGNKFFQKRDYRGAMSKYEEAINVLPRDHVEVSHIRAYMASCYMQLGSSEYPKAIHECDFALKVTPNHSKALLKRARCYEVLNKLDLALRDVCMVLEMDQNNPMASEISDKLKSTLESKGLRVKDSVIELPPDYVEPAKASAALWVVEDKTRETKKKGSNQIQVQSKDEETGKERVIGKKNKKKVREKRVDAGVETRDEHDKEIISEEVLDKSVEEVKKMVKLVYAEDVRWAELPLNCTLSTKEVIHERFPSLMAVHIKYRDSEGDLVT